MFWRIAKNRLMLGWKFRRQYLFRGFILDFYCPQARLGIELEGGIHLKQKNYDALRQAIIESHGIKILRFSNEELLKNPEVVLAKIIENLPLAAFSMKWRRGTTSKQGEAKWWMR